MIRLPEIKTAELSTYGNFATCHQALFRVPREGLGTRLPGTGSIRERVTTSHASRDIDATEIMPPKSKSKKKDRSKGGFKSE